MRALTKDKQTCGSMEPCKVTAIEKYMDEFIDENHTHKRIMALSVKSQNLFKVSFCFLKTYFLCNNHVLILCDISQLLS